jgi:hypothetical protein
MYRVWQRRRSVGAKKNDFNWNGKRLSALSNWSAKSKKHVLERKKSVDGRKKRRA